ncbi:2OG-Fe(II) oxygenase superfamily protein [Apiospora phragmitis]|uniref:2OG-Fe(II) oxygenase superfamily protein n=1 Tax=Apiospora phragmitis TaxID=2905665 RepID=A0ABR1VXI0_9PEZI
MELAMEPRGLFYQENFVTPAHEAELVRVFREELAWPARPPGTRLSLHYGYTFDYKTFGVDPAIPFRPFPDWLRPLIPQTVMDGSRPAQGPGPGLPAVLPARRRHPAPRRHHSAYDELSARPPAAVATEDTGKDDEKSKEEEQEEEEEDDKRAELDLVPRSLLEMRGDARLHWTHGIKKRKTDTLPDGTVRRRRDRWSITYRWLRERADEGTPAECECGNARLCDTAQRRVGIEKEYRWKQQQEQERDKPQEHPPS